MMLLWGRNGIRYGGHVCKHSVSICPSGLVGWSRDDGGAGGKGVGRLWGGLQRTWGMWCQLNFYPRPRANSKWGVLVIKAVYQLCNLQNLAARKLMLGSGAVCIDLPSQVNCAMHCLKEVHVHVLTCVLCCVVQGHRRLWHHLKVPFKNFLRKRTSWYFRPWTYHQRQPLRKHLTREEILQDVLWQTPNKLHTTWINNRS